MYLFPSSIKFFRNLYPHGKNYVVAADVKLNYEKRYDSLIVHFVDMNSLIKELETHAF